MTFLSLVSLTGAVKQLASQALQVLADCALGG